MKYLKVSAVLFIFVCFSSAGFCTSLSSQGKYGIKLDLKDSHYVSNRANETSSVGGSSLDMNPILNSQVNGLMNAMQGMTGNSGSIYSIQEQKKMQGEYAKQQLKNSD